MTPNGYVLLADDNETDAELTTRALELGGVSRNIVWVQDGEAALDYLLRKGQYAQRPAGLPQLMLLDLHMPKIDGLEVLSRIKSDPHLRPIPVVIMSSSDQEIDMTNINPPPRGPAPRTNTTYYVIGAIVVIVVIAVIFFMGRTPDTATDTTTTAPTTEAPATGTEPATPPAEPATPPAGDTTTQ